MCVCVCACVYIFICMYTERERERYELLLKEIKLVQTIDKLKADARKKLTEQTISKELGSMAAPKLWEMSDGSVKEV